MSTTTLYTPVLAGVDGPLVRVEARRRPGVPLVVIAGVAAEAADQMRRRLQAAVVSCGYTWPQQGLEVRLLPTHLPKGGPSMDLAVACAVLAATGQLPPAGLHDAALIGTLGPHGAVHPVAGVLAMVRAAARAGATTVIVPAADAAEAALARRSPSTPSTRCTSSSASPTGSTRCGSRRRRHHPAPAPGPGRVRQRLPGQRPGRRCRWPRPAATTWPSSTRRR